MGLPMREAIPTGIDARPRRSPDRVTSLESMESAAGKNSDTTSSEIIELNL